MVDEAIAPPEPTSIALYVPPHENGVPLKAVRPLESLTMWVLPMVMADVPPVRAPVYVSAAPDKAPVNVPVVPDTAPENVPVVPDSAPVETAPENVAVV